MKNAMKKLMSLVLVAILLVSAVPFAASAADCTGDTACTHDGYNHLATCPKACNGQSDCPQFAAGHTDASYHQAGCLAISKASTPIDNGVACSNSLDCKHNGNQHIAGCPMIPCSNDASCDHGGSNHLATCPYACKNSGSCHADYHLDTCPVGQAESNTATTATYVDVILVTNKTSGFSAGEYYRCNLVNGKITQDDRDAIAQLIVGKNIVAWKRADNKDVQVSTLKDFNFSNLEAPINILPVVGTTSSSTPSNKFPYDIYLNIYVGNKVDAPAKTVKISDTIALDHTVTLDEAMTVVDDYYYATDSTKGIQLDGLYMGKGNWALNFVTDSGKQTTFSNLGAERQENYVFINVMATNVTARGTSTADSSNPKTGDMIFLPIAVLGLSASALAVMFFLNKKRAV